VHRAFTASHAATPVADLPGVYGSHRVGPDSETIAMTFTSARRPNDVWVRESDQVSLRQVTDSTASALDPTVLVEPSHVRYPGADGQEVPALLYVPHAEAVQGGTPGAVIYIHGGPTGQHLKWWDPLPQLLANRGLVVLAPNVRGSTGYGRAWQEANRGDWGGGDLADVLAGADWLIAEGIADPKRIGIAGRGYGGYMALYALGKHPDRFAAGVSEQGIGSWTTLFETTRGDVRDYLARELGDPAEDAALYRDRSPITYAKKIRAPLLVLQAANDPRVPKSEALQIIEATLKNDAPHSYQEYPEPNGPASSANRIDALRRTVDWLSKYLTPLMDRYLTG
jgi:dipeptidyl aminopeptidase/acylaminoacyl peptidase